ncbi:anaerobic C4-dicarboxylate transporter [Spirillospora sp. NPDC048911]|uniref:anaerobic C4-dicarboxylate transporter n=1 Tax=Spirillospora sp. NPDC048911 TaxID=3364527 RepID=UPI003718F853
MIVIEFVVVLAAIFLGVRLGGVAIGFAGGLGVLALAALGVSPGDMPLDVISIIMSVIVAIVAMQIAGGMDYLVDLAEKVLRSNPKYLTFLAPVVTYLMTLMAGTGHTAFSTMPVITEVAKENNLRPARPLSIAVIASQVAITASPISAAVVYFADLLEDEGTGVSYIDLLAVAIPSTFLATMLTAAIMIGVDRLRGTTALDTDPVYRQRLADGQVAHRGGRQAERRPRARLSVLVFVVGLALVMGYATAISENVGLIDDPVMKRDQAIIAIMLGIASVIVLICRVAPPDILGASTFKSGMSASICVLGVAWLGTTFVSAHEDDIKKTAGDLLSDYSWTLAIILFFASALLYSQAATTKALMPTAVALSVAPAALVAAFPAVSALFVLPTYPTLLAAVELDDTGTTRIGKAIFNHPFLVPGALNIALAVALGFGFAALRGI